MNTSVYSFCYSAATGGVTEDIGGKRKCLPPKSLHGSGGRIRTCDLRVMRPHTPVSRGPWPTTIYAYHLPSQGFPKIGMLRMCRMFDADVATICYSALDLSRTFFRRPSSVVAARCLLLPVSEEDSGCHGSGEPFLGRTGRGWRFQYGQLFEMDPTVARRGARRGTFTCPARALPPRPQDV